MRFPSVQLIAIQELLLYKVWRSARRLFVEPPTISKRTECDWIYGASMLIRREAFKSAGGFDHRIWMYGEEMELCYRLGLTGQRTVFEPTAKVIHYGEGSWRGDTARPITLRQHGLLHFYTKHHSTSETFVVWILLLIGTVARCVGAALGILVDGVCFRSAKRSRKRFAIYSSVLLRLFMPLQT
jgi:GT2 family glycosyltransferase